MGVEELAELDQDFILQKEIEQDKEQGPPDRQEPNDVNDADSVPEGQIKETHSDLLKSNAKNLLGSENKTDEQSRKKAPVLTASQEQDQKNQEADQSTAFSSEQVTESPIKITTSNTDELHAIDIIEDSSKSKIDSTTQELDKVESNKIKETLPLYGLQASELINSINDESVANSTIDSEQISTGLFEPLKPKQQFGLSIALVSAIALIVFVTLNPHLLQKLNASFSTPKTTAKKIKLGAAQLELNYYLTAVPKGQVYDRLTGKLLGETPLNWKKNDAKFSHSLFEVRADGYNSQIVSLAGFKVSAKDPNRRVLHLQLKLAENLNGQNTTVSKDKAKSSKAQSTTAETLTNVSKVRSKKKKKQNKNRKVSSKSKRTRRTKKSKVQAKRLKSKLSEAKSRSIKESSKKQDSRKKSPSPEEIRKKVPELLELSPNDPVDPARFKDTIEVEKLP